MKLRCDKGWKMEMRPSECQIATRPAVEGRGDKSLERRRKRPQEPPKRHLRSTKSTQKGVSDQTFDAIS